MRYNVYAAMARYPYDGVLLIAANSVAEANNIKTKIPHLPIEERHLVKGLFSEEEGNMRNIVWYQS